MTSGAIGLTLQEILRQPAAWAQAIEVADRLGPEITAYLTEPEPEQYLFTGCGTSHYLAVAVAGFFQELTGRPARAVPASELLLRPDAHLVPDGRTSLVAFSRSGETTETVVALRRHVRHNLGPTLAVTCKMACAMAGIADITISLPAADDQSVVMTSSFTSMLLAGLLIAGMVGGQVDVMETLRTLPSRLLGQIAAQRVLGQRLGEDLRLQQFIFLGMGPFHGIASEAMLKLKEMTQVPCEAYSPLEFRHGPISVVSPGSAIVLLSSDRGGKHELRVLMDAASAGAKALVLGRAPAPGAGEWVFGVGEDLPDMARAVLYMPLLQCLAYYRAMVLGLDPDRPRHLTQVVRLDAADFAEEA